MYSNPHAARLVSLQMQLDQTYLDIHRRKIDHEWFVEFAAEPAHSELSEVKRQVLTAGQRLDELKAAIDLNQERLTQCQRAASGWLSRLWRSAEQSVAQRQLPELETRLNMLDQSAKKAQATLTWYTQEEQRLNADLQRYRAFDPLEAQALMTQLSEALPGLHSGLEATSQASEQWDARAGGLLRQWHAAQYQLDELAGDMAEAERFQYSLSNAVTARDRALVHQRCQARFGTGNPGSILSDLDKEKRKRQRDLDKLEGRLHDVVGLMAHQIETLIIDGNNLCYAPSENARNRFIGLMALKALVPHLSSTYKVTLMFDPGIRGQLGLDDAALRAAFPQATVVVMQSNAKADDGVLAAAEFDPHAYVISNDKFADYPEHPAVREGKLLTHLIHPQSVQIQQLQINVPFSA